MNSAHVGYRFGPFLLNLERHCLQGNGGVVLPLRPKAFDVLHVLVENAGRMVAKDDLIQAVWQSVIVNDDALAQCIRDIRKVLKDDGERYIRTVPCRGYEFVAEVTPLEASRGSPASGMKAARFSRRTVLIVAAASFGLVLAAFAWSGGWLTERQSTQDARLTIAVLPFANLGENPEENWLGEGIAEDIMTAVSRFRDLTVTARSSSFRYQGERTDVQTVGRELNADFLLQGSVRRSAEQVRISVQLVDAHTGANQWAERYDRPFADIFAIQDEVAENVAAQLVAHAREAAVSRIQMRPPESLSAYEMVLRARKAYRANTHQSAVEGRALVEQAIAIDPDFAPAWALLGRLLNHFYTIPYDENYGSPDMLRQVRSAAEKAVALDPGYSTGHSILGFALAAAGELDAGIEALRRAISLNPNDETAISMYANLLDRAGHSREAIEVWERYERLDPAHPPLTLALKARAHILAGEFEPALTLTRSCAERAPRLPWCFLYLAVAAKELGREEEAQAAAERVLEINPKFTISSLLALLRFRDEENLANYLRRSGFPE